MIFDRLTEFSPVTGQDLGSMAAGSKCFANYIDLSNPSTLAKDIGNGEPIYFILEAVTDIFAAGAGTIQFKLGSTDTIPTDAAVMTSGTYHWTGPVQTTQASTGTVANKTIAGSKIACVALPLDTYKKFLAVEVTVATQTLGAGVLVRAFLSLDPTGTKAYPAAVTY